MKHGPVADAVPDSWVGGVQDRLHLLGSEMPDEATVRLFCGDGENALDLPQRRWHAIFHVAHEGLYGREPDVSGPNAIAARSFQMPQEVRDQRSLEVLQVKLRRRNFDAIAGVFEQ